MNIKIALAGNPNCGKTTLFNALTGSNQYVGNWPGVTVEKKEGKLKKDESVTITDLPGIYSLSPYTLEEVVARDYLVGTSPDAIINLVDGTNLERNLYLTTQLLELGIPVVIAVNMMDIVEKSGDKINLAEMSRSIGCPVVGISAVKKKGFDELISACLEAVKSHKVFTPRHSFSGPVEHVIAHIEEHALSNLRVEKQRWFAIKLFERDEKVQKSLNLNESVMREIEEHIKECEKELDDDSEAIITAGRYVYIAELIKSFYKKKNKEKKTRSDKIDKIVTNRILALPIFAVIMFCVYALAMSPNAIGTYFTDWANDGLFGDGWFALSIGRKAYDEKAEVWAENDTIVSGYEAYAEEKGVSPSSISSAPVDFVDEETGLVSETRTIPYSHYSELKAWLEENDEPEPRSFGPWVPGVPVLVEAGLDKINTAPWLKGLILDGIIAGVGAVLGFIPQIIILFILLALLEGCGYMARIAFVMDRIFRRFGLSGKSFIPILVSTGCGVPGIMATRTIEAERDRRMTIMTTTFIPCSAKLPFISMIAGSIFGNSPLVAVGAYFIGLFSIIFSGIILKKTRAFAGKAAPFVMELPAYHMPTLTNVWRSLVDRVGHYIKKAGTLILLSTIIVWFLSRFGFIDGSFRLLEEDEISSSLLRYICSAFKWIFAPLGWGTWQGTAASFTGLIAKENIVATLNILYPMQGEFAGSFTSLTGFSFLVFNLLCAPCFAAMGTIKGEMNSSKWFAFAILYECGFAWALSFMIYQIGSIFTHSLNIVGLIVALLCLAGFVYMAIRRPSKTARLA